MVSRRIAAAAVTVVATLTLATPASAGGNWLDFKEQPGRGASGDGGRSLGTWAVLHAGQRVVASSGGLWLRVAELDRLLAGGPYYAWLVPEPGFAEGDPWPSAAVRLAPFELSSRGERTATTRAGFTVPLVPSGTYQVLVCDDPCTVLGFGDFVEGWVDVWSTPDEARLFELARDREERARAFHQRLRVTQREADELGAALESARRDARASEERIATLERTGSRLQRRLAENEMDAGTASVTWWIAAIALLLGAAIGAIVARRRPAIVVPDVVPDELVELERRRAADREGAR